MYWHEQPILAIHLTEHCNFNCSYCYLHKYPDKREISFELVKKAVTKINPKTLFLFGGEPLICLSLVKQIIETIPRNIILITNGLLLTDDLMDYFIKHKVQVTISLDSFNRDGNLGRPFTENQFKNILRLLNKYGSYEHLYILGCIDENSFGVVEFYTELINRELAHQLRLVSSEHVCDIKTTSFYREYKQYPSELKESFTAENKVPNSRVDKLRLHPDGTISRTYIPGKSVLCHVDTWDDSIHTLYPDTYAKECLQCEYFSRCIVAGGFTVWTHEVSSRGILQQTFCCQASKLLLDELQFFMPKLPLTNRKF